MAFVAQTGNDNYIDFLSAHALAHASQAQVEGCRTNLGVEYFKASTPYLISGLVTL